MRGMKKSRLAVNSGKTKLMCLASSQKRAIMKRNGEGREFEVNIEGKRIEEMAKGTILGITWSSDLCWRYHLECVGKSYRTKSRAISQIMHYLSERTGERGLDEHNLIWVRIDLMRIRSSTQETDSTTESSRKNGSSNKKKRLAQRRKPKTTRLAISATDGITFDNKTVSKNPAK